MKAKVYIIVFLILSIHLKIFGQSVLLDRTTAQPIPFAQILNNKGAVIGTTDIDGILPQNLSNELVTIQHIAYKPQIVNASQFKKGGTIFLTPFEYNFPEVTVTVKNADYIYLRTFFRSYQLNDSCMKYYKDGFIDFVIYLKQKKVERFIRKVRNFQNNELIQKDKKRTNVLVDKYIYIPYLDHITLVEKLKKRGWKYNNEDKNSRLYLNGIVGGVISKDSIHKRLRVEYDVLATKDKKHKKLFGYTTRLENYYQTENYVNRPNYQSYMDLLCKKDYRKLLFSYKTDTKEQLVEVFDELYVLEHKYISKEELKQHKETWKSKFKDSSLKWEIDSTIVTPLAPPFRQILKNHLTQIE